MIKVRTSLSCAELDESVLNRLISKILIGEVKKDVYKRQHYTGSMVCSKQLFKEALGHTYDEPKRWQLHNINEIMNTCLLYTSRCV